MHAFVEPLRYSNGCPIRQSAYRMCRFGSEQSPLIGLLGSARSGSLLERKVNDTDSEILRHYLKGDFPGTFELVRRSGKVLEQNFGPYRFSIALRKPVGD